MSMYPNLAVVQYKRLTVEFDDTHNNDIIFLSEIMKFCYSNDKFAYQMSKVSFDNNVITILINSKVKKLICDYTNDDLEFLFVVYENTIDCVMICEDVNPTFGSFGFRKLSAYEKKYDVNNKELITYVEFSNDIIKSYMNMQRI